MAEKRYVPPAVKMQGNTKLLIVAAIHKGCPSSSAKSKKG
jgi:hypothetical protein